MSPMYLLSQYINVDTNTDGITWKDNSVPGESDVEKNTRLDNEASELAKAALTFAKGKITATATETKNEDNTISFDKLDLGYYLVDSSVGALCGLTTTNPTVSIQDKNEAPTLTKKVKNLSRFRASASVIAWKAAFAIGVLCDI